MSAPRGHQRDSTPDRGRSLSKWETFTGLDQSNLDDEHDLDEFSDTALGTSSLEWSSRDGRCSNSDQSDNGSSCVVVGARVPQRQSSPSRHRQGSGRHFSPGRHLSPSRHKASLGQNDYSHSEVVYIGPEVALQNGPQSVSQPHDSNRETSVCSPDQEHSTASVRGGGEGVEKSEWAHCNGDLERLGHGSLERLGHGDLECTGHDDLESTGHSYLERAGHDDLESTGHGDLERLGNSAIERSGRGDFERHGSSDLERSGCGPSHNYEEPHRLTESHRADYQSLEEEWNLYASQQELDCAGLPSSSSSSQKSSDFGHLLPPDETSHYSLASKLPDNCGSEDSIGSDVFDQSMPSGPAAYCANDSVGSSEVKRGRAHSEVLEGDGDSVDDGLGLVSSLCTRSKSESDSSERAQKPKPSKSVHFSIFPYVREIPGRKFSTYPSIHSFFFFFLSLFEESKSSCTV